MLLFENHRIVRGVNGLCPLTPPSLLVPFGNLRAGVFQTFFCWWGFGWWFTVLFHALGGFELVFGFRVFLGCIA
jgi:hypothetical protein